MISQALNVFLNIFRFHLKKIFFLFASIVFWFLILFPYDDLSDFVTLKVTQMTQSNVYLQFDGLSFGLMPQLALKMEDVVVESVYAPALAMKTLGFAPKMSILFGNLGGKLKAYGLFGGDAVVDLGPSNELDAEGQEFGVSVNLEKVSLKELSKFIKKAANFPLSMNGETELESKIYVDPTFKKQPKGNLQLVIDQLEIPSSNLALQGGLSMPFPALKLSNVLIQGSINDGKFYIKEGKIGSGEKNDDLYGQVTGDFFFDIRPGGRFVPSGYDLKINLNISENLKRQLSAILGFVDIYQGIGSKYKFDSLKGVRYSMRVSARNMQSPPRITNY